MMFVHVDRLIPYTSPDGSAGHPCLSCPPPHTANSVKYEVDKIVNSRQHCQKLHYFVQWKGYANEDMQWVAASDFHHNDSLVLDFARRHPTKTVPHATRQAADRSSVTITAPPATLPN